MAVQYSTIAQKQKSANGANRVEVADAYGRVRMVALDGVLSTADKDVVLYHFPAGRVRILKVEGLGGSDSLKHLGYTKMDGSTQAAASVTLNDAGAVFESISGFDLVASFNTAPTANTTTLDLLVTFVID